MNLESLVRDYCLFFRDSRIESGWIEGVQKNKLIVKPLQGKTQFLPPNRILFSWRKPVPPKSIEEAHAILRLDVEKAQELKTKQDLETIHDLLESGKEYRLEEISEDFLDSTDDPLEMISLLLALREDSRWFKCNRNLSYTPRSPQELEQIDIQNAREQERTQKAEQLQAWIARLESNSQPSPVDLGGEAKTWLDSLLHILIHGHECRQWKDMAPLLGWGQVMGYAEERKLKLWMERAGRSVTPTLLILLRANAQMDFPAEVRRESDEISRSPLPEHPSVSEHFPTFTIDAEKTEDYDDAFTVYEWNTAGLELEVHITDFCHAVSPDSLVFLEAENRLSSLYTPEGVIPMLPAGLSNEAFSLKAGVERSVLSFHFNLFRKGGWKLVRVQPQRIRVQQNLSYEQADALIERKESFWEMLDTCCGILRQHRIDSGALNLTRKEFEIDISDPQNVIIRKLDRNSAANRIIEELSILVNRETGRFFQKKQQPGIFRTQAAYELVKDVPEGEPLSLEHISIEAAKLSMVPSAHAGLGCEIYMQATSPIRRFIDLITQRQLRYLLAETDCEFSNEQLMRWAESIQIRQREYTRAEREVTHYWKSRYLQQHPGYIHAARVRRQLPNKRTEYELVELDYLFVTTGFDSLAEGETLFLMLEEIHLDPLRLSVRPRQPNEESTLHQLS